MQPTDLLILSLATWRLAYLITKEAAPFSMMQRIRERATLGGLLTCIYCTSVWVAVLFVLIVRPVIDPMLIIYLFAVSGGAMILHRYTGGDFSG